VLLLIATANTQAQLALLHSFAGSPNDGLYPYGNSLTQVGSTFYGLTNAGGISNWGTVFRINTDGSGYTNLHSFGSVVDDGSYPYGSLTARGPTLYGMTAEGGINNSGAIFRINTDGSGYTNLHSFGSVADEGSYPYGSLTLVGSTLYGLTYAGGISNSGAIFRIKTDGSGYTNLHSFGSVADDGTYPYFGSLTARGPTLYGMTYAGGTGNDGVIFSLGIMAVTKLQAKVNFDPAKSDIDTCSLTVTLGLDPGFSVTNQPVTADIGGAQESFTLDAKGSSKSSTNSCKLSYTGKSDVWTLTASLNNGSWATEWAQYGMTNATTPNGVKVTMPVTVTLNTNTFAADKTLNYKGSFDKSGTLK
jgi:uncharacterized repeat protein (TIGR03803 family)